jgi:RNA polymerase sigma-70 factor (ECF subfamily)
VSQVAPVPPAIDARHSNVDLLTRIPVVDIGDADVVLMRAIARGERSAFAALYDRHAAVALALARRMLGATEMAEDVVQDGFLTIWRKARDFRSDEASPRTWLLTIVRNRCIDEVRRRARAQRGGMLSDAQPSAIDDDPWPEIWKRHCGDVVRDALGTLSPEQRTAIELAFYGGLTHNEIAERLDAPLGTIKKRVRSGLQRLRSRLDQGYAETTNS